MTSFDAAFEAHGVIHRDMTNFRHPACAWCLRYLCGAVRGQSGVNSTGCSCREKLHDVEVGELEVGRMRHIALCCALMCRFCLLPRSGRVGERWLGGRTRGPPPRVVRHVPVGPAHHKALSLGVIQLLLVSAPVDAVPSPSISSGRVVVALCANVRRGRSPPRGGVAIQKVQSPYRCGECIVYQNPATATSNS